MKEHITQPQRMEENDPPPAFGSSFFDTEEDDPFPFETFGGENNFFSQNTNK